MRREYNTSYKDVTLKADNLDDKGKGIVRYDSSTLFVSGLLKGEEGIVRIVYKGDKIVDAFLIKRLTSSELRVEPKCPYYFKCGGCSLMHLRYDEQLKYKQEKVRNLLHKFGKIDVEVNPTLGMDDPYRFRNKVQVPIGRLKGKTVFGFYEENSHYIVPINDCLIESKRASEILNFIVRQMDKYHIEAYQEDARRGLIRHVLIKESLHYKETMVVLVTSRNEMYGKVNFAKEIADKFPEVTTVVQNVNTRRTNVILGEEEHILLGSGRIKDSIFGLSFLISAKSFYQTNPIQLEVLYKTALESAHLQKDDSVLDAYSGTGTIGLSASKYVKDVTLVEIVSSSVKDGKENAKINNITNAAFIREDCTTYLVKNKASSHFNVVFMDPPRAGSTKEFLQALIEIKPDRIVYVSCNPVTLARDLSLLKDSYDINSVTPVDMFPHTAHVETVAALELKDSRK